MAVMNGSFILAVMNGSFILAVIQEVAILAVNLCLKKVGSNIIAVKLLAIQQTMAVVNKVKELKDRWVSSRMTVSTPNWFKGLLLLVSQFW